VNNIAIHEAGHLVVAVYHKLPVEDFRKQNGKATIWMKTKHWYVDMPEQAAEYLAAGVAAEQIKFPTASISDGGEDDRNKFAQIHDGNFSDYVSKSRTIILDHQEQFKRLIHKLVIVLAQAYADDDDGTLLDYETIAKLAQSAMPL
jgi:hypothetical protein